MSSTVTPLFLNYISDVGYLQPFAEDTSEDQTHPELISEEFVGNAFNDGGDRSIMAD